MFFSLKCLINQIEIMEEIMVTYIDFDELGKFYGMTMDELKAKSYFELEKMEAEMSNSRSLKKLSDANF